jgi:gliding motility-associated-like protein
MQHSYKQLLKFLSVILLIWLFANNANAQQNGPTPYKFKYRVTAIKSGASSVSSISNVADVVPKPLIYIPNAFTPNGDGLNDGFGVKAEGIQEFRLEIFNRWGELIFSTTDINEQWDGTFKGRKLENTEVFVYKVSAAGMDSQPQKYNGTVTLVYE